MRALKLVGLAAVVAVALSGCLTLRAVSGVGGPTWKRVEPTYPGFDRLANDNLSNFNCVQGGELPFGDYGECDAHYEGVGFIVPIPGECLSVLEQANPFHQAPPPGGIGPIDVAVVEPDTGHVLAHVPDATTWMAIDPAGYDAHYVLATGVVFTMSGKGEVVRGNRGSAGDSATIETEHVPALPEYIGRVTCASSLDTTTGVSHRTTQVGTIKPT